MTEPAPPRAGSPPQPVAAPTPPPADALPADAPPTRVPDQGGGLPQGARAEHTRPEDTRPEDALPERVRERMADHQESSEILIGWVQLALVVGFGTLYVISPKTFPAEAEFRPIPWVLGAYLAFTLIRLYLAYRRRLPSWFLSLSVVADAALLLGTIWSFHLQYMQPAAFYLKAPTVLYLFIFIALRALRFEPRYVILSGVTASLGWVLMVVYAVYLDGMNSPVTRDYVYYLTTNAVLIGAEFDKIVSILVVTAIIAVAIVRARRLLVMSVRESLAARELSRFFASDVAARIVDLDREIEAGRGEVRDAAVVNVDMRGFSQMAAHIDPDDLIALLSDYQRLVVPLIQEHGGSIDKFLGDGIMATFGATRPSETPTADALRAVDAIARATEDWCRRRAESGLPAPAVGAAVAAGPVVFGAVGDDTRLEYTVIGAAVNLSAKLEKHTKAERVRALTDAETYRAAVAQGYRPNREPERRDARAVLGLDDPIDLVVLA